ncbi:MAG: PLDc N-terminal domain-containing protein [Cyclobacteriaceae bacterium]|nr:PLDc N-terminal domain-containing protein [Cyclobacteriaceae bacterium]
MNSVLLLSMPGNGEWIIILAMILIPVFCLVDIFKSVFPNDLTKWAWCAMVVFVPLIGAVLYYWFGTEQKVTSKG